jgi:parallel beta-helix repeat protein
MSKLLLWAFFTVIAICGLTLAGSVHFGSGQAGTSVTGIIKTDTIWNKANSPYSLTGPVAVATGTTLTIDSGVTVNINNYILVNGTLRAIGSNTDQIHFNGGYISFGQTSTSWNEQSGYGSIIENSNIDSPQVYSAIGINSSPKISHNTISGGIQVSQNSSCIISNNYINGEVVVTSTGTVTISNNAITNPLHSNENYGIHIENSNGIIVDNAISNCKIGIFAYNANPTIGNNTISGCSQGISIVSGSSPTIQANLVTGNGDGVYISSGSCIVQGNTIVNNTNGIYIGHEQKYFFGFYWSEPSPTIKYNNMYANSNKTIFAVTTNNITAVNNWWGTTDPAAIGQMIRDNKNDYNVGTVNFIPFLTEPNSQATPGSNPPTPSPSPNPMPVNITVSVPPSVVPKGTQITIVGNVLGVVNGAVQLTALDPNGNTESISTVSIDINGYYSVTWTPPLEGNYTIIATFVGAISKATTQLTVSSDTSKSTTSPSPNTVPSATLTPSSIPTQNQIGSPSIGPTSSIPEFPTSVGVTLLLFATLLILVIIGRRNQKISEVSLKRGDY